MVVDKGNSPCDDLFTWKVEDKRYVSVHKDSSIGPHCLIFLVQSPNNSLLLGTTDYYTKHLRKVEINRWNSPANHLPWRAFDALAATSALLHFTYTAPCRIKTVHLALLIFYQQQETIYPYPQGHQGSIFCPSLKARSPQFKKYLGEYCWLEFKDAAWLGWLSRQKMPWANGLIELPCW